MGLEGPSGCTQTQTRKMVNLLGTCVSAANGARPSSLSGLSGLADSGSHIREARSSAVSTPREGRVPSTAAYTGDALSHLVQCTPKTSSHKNLSCSGSATSLQILATSGTEQGRKMGIDVAD